MQPDQNTNPLTEQAPQPQLIEKPSETQEMAPANIEKNQTPGSSPSSTQVTPVVTPQPQSSGTQTLAQQPTSSPVTIDPTLTQLPAEDADVIEKVWVEKTDQIIEKDQDDPRAEDDAQHNLSRAYLKKRFNLDVQ